ncbi:MAG TPA: efflux RND transporter periplasmic adaptor subunit [Gallionellaceae bacterium]|nr:efflux RND transporter periplasmic adaptor subunit [Gallionellaceae bacterium]
MKNWTLFAIAVLFPQASWAAEVPATLQWSQRVELSVPVSGVIQAVNVDVGDQVKKGQVLLALDGAIYQAKVAENQSAITRLSAEAAEAKRDFERVQELYARTVVATAERDQAKLRLTRADALLAEARASLRQQQKVLDDTLMRAPFDGIVVARQAEPGMSIAAGLQSQILLVLAKSGEMLARLYLSATQIEKLKAGQALTVTVGSQSYAGKVKALGLEPVKLKDEAGYQVDVSFVSKEQLRAGIAAVVKLP